MNLSFLHPWALLAAPLAAAPWLLHRWALSKAVKRPFPTLELLRAALRASFASSLLSHRLLLFLRTLFMAFLILLLSRPVLRWGGERSSGAALRVILAVDLSASMGARVAGRSRLDWAMKEAEAFRPGAGGVQSAALIAFSDRVEASFPMTDDATRFDENLRALRLTARPTRVEAAFAAAAALPAGKEGAKPVLVLLTDGAENGWRGLRVDPSPFAQVVVARAPRLEANAGVTGVSLSGPAREGRLEAMGWGAAPGDRGWTLSWEGRPAAQGRLALGRGAAGAAFPSVSAPPFSRGEAALDPDGFAADDVFYLLPPAASRVGVLVVNGAPSLAPTADETYYLAPVLEGLARDGGRFKILSPEAFAGENLEDWNVLLFANVGALPAGASAKVQSFVERGGGLWVTAGDRFAPRLFAPWLPAQPTGVTLQDAGMAPAGTFFKGADFEWGKLHADKMAEALLAPGAETVLSARPSGRPLLALGRFGRGRTAFLAVGLDRDGSNLPARPLFPVLCRQVLAHLAGADSGGAASLRVDEPWEGPWTGGAPLVERPDGSTEEAAVRAGRFRYEKTDVPGFYTLRPKGAPGLLSRAAVNADRASGEGDPSLADPALFGEGAAWVDAPSSVLSFVKEREGGRPLSPALAALIAALFALETFLLGWMKR